MPFVMLLRFWPGPVNGRRFIVNGANFSAVVTVLFLKGACGFQQLLLMSWLLRKVLSLFDVLKHLQLFL